VPRTADRHQHGIPARARLGGPLTVIVGLVHKHRVHLGGDSAGVSGYQLTVRRDPKVFTNGPYVMGFTTSFRMGQLLRHAFKVPRPKGDLDRFMVTGFVDALRSCLKDGGWARKDAEQEQAGTFLVGIHGRLFSIESDYQVAEPADGYAAVGGGDELALGALHATAVLGMKPRQRLTAALAAADHHSAGVVGPYTFAVSKRAA
jgi:ATP-dependent protease HslVU (ClpYQ) peptidase subunit